MRLLSQVEIDAIRSVRPTDEQLLSIMAPGQTVPVGAAHHWIERQWHALEEIAAMRKEGASGHKPCQEEIYDG